MDKQELRAVIMYLYLKGMTPQEIFIDMKCTLAESAPAYSTVIKWHVEFKRGRLLCVDMHRSGRHATSVNEETVEEVHQLVMND